jgi:protein TonB
MLAYAASRPTPVERRPHPNTMLAIIALHVGVAAIVMSAKVDLPGRIFREPPIRVTLYPDPPKQDPIEQPKTQQTQQPVQNQPITKVDPQVVTHPTDIVDQSPLTPPVRTGVLVEGTGSVSIPQTVHDVVKLGPRLLTSGEDLKPPYPASKLITEEEAALQLRLTIDANGRVVGVDPVGRADPVFLSAARRWLLAHWRYRPATEDGRGVTSTEVITLRFQLDG